MRSPTAAAAGAQGAAGGGAGAVAVGGQQTELVVCVEVEDTAAAGRGAV